MPYAGRWFDVICNVHILGDYYSWGIIYIYSNHEFFNCLGSKEFCCVHWFLYPMGVYEVTAPFYLSMGIEHI